MSDEDSEAGTAAGRGDARSGGDEYTLERLVTREAGAAALRLLADGVASGSVELGDEEVTVTVPERFELKIEYEGEDDEAELEVELEWPIVDGEAVAAERISGPTEHGDTGGTEMGEYDAEPDEPVGKAEDDKPIEAVVGVGETASKARFELYRDRTDEWRWRLVHDNGNIIADSGEGYDRKAAARNGLESVMHNAHGAPVVVLED